MRPRTRVLGGLATIVLAAAENVVANTIRDGGRGALVLDFRRLLAGRALLLDRAHRLVDVGVRRLLLDAE